MTMSSEKLTERLRFLAVMVVYVETRETFEPGVGHFLGSSKGEVERSEHSGFRDSYEVTPLLVVIRPMTLA